MHCHPFIFHFFYICFMVSMFTPLFYRVLVSFNKCKFSFDVCVTVQHWYNDINNQLDATITNFIDNYNQLNMFRMRMGEIIARNMLSWL